MSDVSLRTTEEIWKPVVGHPGYEVSNRGRVRSFLKRIGRGCGRGTRHVIGDEPSIVVGGAVNSGHRFVYLGGSGRKGNKFVHRLVLEAFVGPCPEGKEACHDPDRNPENNNVENLRWATHSENAKDSVRHGSNNPGRGTNRNVGEANGGGKLTEADVVEIRKFIKEGWFYWFIGLLFGCSRGAIANIAIGKTWNHSYVDFSRLTSKPKEQL